MKIINRAMLRGQKLDEDCKKAYISAYECGPNDNRKYCYGLYDGMTEELIDKCKNCKAYVSNVTPINEGEAEYMKHMDVYG